MFITAEKIVTTIGHELIRLKALEKAVIGVFWFPQLGSPLPSNCKVLAFDPSLQNRQQMVERVRSYLRDGGIVIGYIRLYLQGKLLWISTTALERCNSRMLSEAGDEIALVWKSGHLVDDIFYNQQ